MSANLAVVRTHPATRSLFERLREAWPRQRRRLAWTATILVLAGYALSGLHAVPPDSSGYLRLFGKVVRRDLPPGLHWAPPFPLGGMDVWRTAFPRKTDVGFRTDLEMIPRRREIRLASPPEVWHSPAAAMNADPDVGTYLSGDENLLEMSFAVHYVVSDPYAYFYGLDRDLDAVELYAQAAARRILAADSLDALLTADRPLIERRIRDGLQAHLDGIGAGIRVTSVHVIDIHPPQEAVHAFRDVSSAREDRATSIQEAYGAIEREIPVARGEAALEVAQKTAAAEAAMAVARGKADAYAAQVEAFGLHPQILEDLLWLETSERVLEEPRKYIVPEGTREHGVILWDLPPAIPPAPSGGPEGD